MALLFAEHFDGYTDTTGYRNAVENVTNNCSYSAAGGRFGGGAVENGSLVVGDTRLLKASPGTNMIRAAFYLKCNRSSSTVGDRDILRFQDSGATRFWRLTGTNGGAADASTLTPSKYDDTTTPANLALGTKTVWNDNVWHHIEIALSAHITTGSFKLKIDGVEQTEFTVSSGDTSDAASGDVTTFDRVAFCGSMVNTGSVFGLFVDDLIVWDDSGSEFTGELTAEHRLRAVVPTADGAGGVQWTPLSGANYTNVDEVSYDSDTTYVSETTIGDIDYYNAPSLGWTPVSIKGIVVESIGRLDTGTHSWRNKLKSSTTVSNGVSKAATTTYRKTQDFYTFDPHTSALWTKANVEAAQFGVEFVS